MSSSESRRQGTVHDFDSVNGRGVIITDGGERVSVRYSAIVGQGKRELKPGDRVSLEIEQNGERVSAVQVQRHS